MITPRSRVHDGMYQTPLCEFEHPQTGSNIGVVGVIHLGEQSYFDTVSDYILDREDAGAQVHYEGLKPASKVESVKFKAEAKQAEAMANSLNTMHYVIAEALGVQSQGESIDYASSWQNHDIGRVELVRLLGAKGVSRLTQLGDRAEKLEAALSPELLAATLRAAFRFTPIFIPMGIVLRRHERKILVDHRNEIALAGIDDTLSEEPDRDIALLWGAGHLPGIGKGLQQRGYRLTDRSWLSAFPLTYEGVAQAESSYS
jgi:hypothetical protein